MTTFYTITDETSDSTNSRSTRYPSLERAIQSASSRLSGNSNLKGVIVLQAVKLVKRESPPITVEDISPTFEKTSEENDSPSVD